MGYGGTFPEEAPDTWPKPFQPSYGDGWRTDLLTRLTAEGHREQERTAMLKKGVPEGSKKRKAPLWDFGKFKGKTLKM